MFFMSPLTGFLDVRSASRVERQSYSVLSAQDEARVLRRFSPRRIKLLQTLCSSLKHGCRFRATEPEQRRRPRRLGVQQWNLGRSAERPQVNINCNSVHNGANR